MHDFAIAEFRIEEFACNYFMLFVTFDYGVQHQWWAEC
jgi:hypothetical protein